MERTVKEIEGTFTVPPGGPVLYTKTWIPTKRPVIARLVFFHGFSDHMGRYYGLFPSLAERGIAVFGLDQRGWGRSAESPKQRGVTGPTATVLADMVAFIRHVVAMPLHGLVASSASPSRPGSGSRLGSAPSMVLSADPAEAGAAPAKAPAPAPAPVDGKGNAANEAGIDNDNDYADVPLFVMGHSMGGGQVLTLMCSTDEVVATEILSKVRGWLVESAFVQFAPAERPNVLAVFFGKLAARLLPRFQLTNKFDVVRLTRDAEVQESLRRDPLYNGVCTLEGVAGMLERTNNLDSCKFPVNPAVQGALFMAHGTVDFVTSFDSARRWFEFQTGREVDQKTGAAAATATSAPAAPNMKDATWKTFEGNYHQLHSDYGRDQFYADVGEWIVARCGNDGEAAAAVAAPAPAAEAPTNGQPPQGQAEEPMQQVESIEIPSEPAKAAKL